MQNTEEVLAIVKEEGIELTDEQLEAVSGGIVQPFLQIALSVEAPMILRFPPQTY